MNIPTLEERIRNNTTKLFNEGDKVEIRKDLNKIKDWALFGVNEVMLRYASRTVEIKDVVKTKTRGLNDENTDVYKYFLKGNSWSWSADMFVLKEENEV
ncbi:hypothetical protein [Romboutsia sp.]|uniref:hypothetical protein n=1 Tax=Romboutsia sp. TaxID=1965302 RepID=UPI002D0E5C7A|nr:hypothetical protein [Romboutsia sp.]HSQ90195.1 hypothetical protein [Romboutsia sp.]